MRHNKKLFIIKRIVDSRLASGWIKDNHIIDEALKLNKLPLNELEDIYEIGLWNRERKN
jgi:hypothetical protein